MKKLNFTMALLLIITLLFTACGKKAKPIELPTADIISSIEIPGGIEDIIVTDKELISSFIEKVQEAKPTSKQSVHDLPTVPEYIRVDFVGDNIFKSIFVYQENSKWYIEQAYIGIYETDGDLLKILIGE
jgi:predicted small lipoprotein YifL